MTRTIAIFLVLVSVTIAGTVSGPGRVKRLPSTAAAAYLPPGYAATTVWFDGSWTNSSGYIPDLSASGTNYGFPLLGAGQPTPTNYPAGNSCWYFNGANGIMITNSPLVSGGIQWTNATWRVWAKRTASSAGYINTVYDGSAFGGLYYNAGYGLQYNGTTYSLGADAVSNWVHLVMTASRSGANVTLNVWTSGVHKLTNAVVSCGNNNQGQFAQLGQTYLGTVRWTGYIDEFLGLTNYVWTGLEATNDFNSTKATYGY